MLNVFNIKPNSFGLNISDSSVKVAKIKKSGNSFRLSSWNKIKLDAGIIEDGEIKNEKGFIDYVKEAVKTAQGSRIETKNVVFSLPENKAFFVVIQMPKMTEEELKLAVPFEAENYIPFKLEEFYSDFEIIKPMQDNLDHLDILVAAIPKKIADSYVDCLKKAGLIPYALEIEPQSICRAVIKNEVSPFPILVVDFEEKLTNLVIFSGFSIYFTSSIPFSSLQLTKAVSEYFNIDLKEAEKLKIKYGLQRPDYYSGGTKIKKDEKLKKGVFEAVTSVLSELTSQIKKYINYYQTHGMVHQHLWKKNMTIQKIILCGEEASLKGISSFIEYSLKVPTEIADPWVNIMPKTSKIAARLSFQESLGYVAVLGLALRGIKGEKLLK